MGGQNLTIISPAFPIFLGRRGNYWPDKNGRYWWKITLENGKTTEDYFWAYDTSAGSADRPTKTQDGKEIERYIVGYYDGKTYHTIEGFSYVAGSNELRYTECGAIKAWMEEKDRNYYVTREVIPKLPQLLQTVDALGEQLATLTAKQNTVEQKAEEHSDDSSSRASSSSHSHGQLSEAGLMSLDEKKLGKSRKKERRKKAEKQESDSTASDAEVLPRLTASELDEKLIEATALYAQHQATFEQASEAYEHNVDEQIAKLETVKKALSDVTEKIGQLNQQSDSGEVQAELARLHENQQDLYKNQRDLVAIVSPLKGEREQRKQRQEMLHYITQHESEGIQAFYDVVFRQLNRLFLTLSIASTGTFVLEDDAWQSLMNSGEGWLLEGAESLAQKLVELLDLTGAGLPLVGPAVNVTVAIAKDVYAQYRDHKIKQGTDSLSGSFVNNEYLAQEVAMLLAYRYEPALLGTRRSAKPSDNGTVISADGIEMFGLYTAGKIIKGLLSGKVPVGLSGDEAISALLQLVSEEKLTAHQTSGLSIGFLEYGAVTIPGVHQRLDSQQGEKSICAEYLLRKTGIMERVVDENTKTVMLTLRHPPSRQGYAKSDSRVAMYGYRWATQKEMGSKHFKTHKVISSLDGQHPDKPFSHQTLKMAERLSQLPGIELVGNSEAAKQRKKEEKAQRERTGLWAKAKSKLSSEKSQAKPADSQNPASLPSFTKIEDDSTWLQKKPEVEHGGDVETRGVTHQQLDEVDQRVAQRLQTIAQRQKTEFDATLRVTEDRTSRRLDSLEKRLDETKGGFGAEQATLEEMHKALKEELQAEHEGEVGKLREQLKSANDSLGQANAKIDALSSQHAQEQKQAQEKLEELQGQYNEVVQTAKKQEVQLKAAEESLEQADKKIEGLSEQLQHTSDNLEHADKKIKELEKTLKGSEQEVAETKGELVQLQKNFEKQVKIQTELSNGLEYINQFMLSVSALSAQRMPAPVSMTSSWAASSSQTPALVSPQISQFGMLAGNASQQQSGAANESSPSSSSQTEAETIIHAPPQ